MHKRIALIAAMTSEQVIGYQNRLPWDLPQDLQYFRQMTLGKPIIMGHKTFASMGYKPLPKRQNILLSRDLHCQYNGVQVVCSLDEALAITEPSEEIMVIGGEQIYALFLPRASRLYVSLIEGCYPGDTFFPKIDWKDWTLVSEQPMDGFKTQIFDRKTLL